jgi:hypothetical protein
MIKNKSEMLGSSETAETILRDDQYSRLIS